MTVNWIPRENELGIQAISTASSTQQHKVGKIVRATDATLGGGEFIYLKGCTSNFVGAVVTYAGGTAALSTTSGVVTGGAPMAVSMSTATGSQWGWFQISGDATLFKTAVKFDPASGNRVYISGTAGRIMQTSVAGRQILGARFDSATTVTSTTSTAIVTLNRPTQKSGTAV